MCTEYIQTIDTLRIGFACERAGDLVELLLLQRQTAGRYISHDGLKRQSICTKHRNQRRGVDFHDMLPSCHPF